MLATPYKKPERYGSILLPQTSADDMTSTLFEVLAVGPRVEREVGSALRATDIIKVGRLTATDSGSDDAEGRPIYSIEASTIKAITRWDDEDD